MKNYLNGKIIYVNELYKMVKKKNNYIHGGSRTPQYYCPVCRHAHTIHSKIGKEHMKYAQK